MRFGIESGDRTIGWIEALFPAGGLAKREFAAYLLVIPSLACTPHVFDFTPPF